LLQWKSKNYYIFWVCSLRNLACSAHAPYSQPSPLRLYNVLHIKRQDFRGKKSFERKVCVLIFIQLLSETFHILRRTEIDVIRAVYLCSSKVPVIIRFWWNFNFIDRFLKTLKYQISSQSVDWETSCSMRTDGQTDRQTWRN